MPWSASDFSSDSGMLTAVWGPALWHTLHTISFNYPTRPDRATKKKYKKFLKSLRHVLPCMYCRDNYRQNIRDAGYSERIFDNREAFSRFVFDLHNHVNKMLGKAAHPSYERVRTKYENFRSRCLQNPDDASCRPPAAAQATEKGCTEPLYGKKSKCLIRIVPKDSPHRTFAMDSQCKVRRGTAAAPHSADTEATSDHTPGSISTR